MVVSCMPLRLPPAAGAERLAAGAVMGAASTDDEPFDGAAAAPARLAAAAVHLQPLLERAAVATDRPVVVEGGALGGDAFGQHVADRLVPCRHFGSVRCHVSSVWVQSGASQRRGEVGG